MRVGDGSVYRAPIVLAAIAVAVMASCRPLVRPGGPRPPDGDVEQPVATTAEPEAAPMPAEPSSDSISQAVAAIIDSIEAVVRDSIEQIERIARDSLEAAARRDSVVAAARRDSIEAAARDSIAAAVRRDSIAAAARRDSIEAALRDSVAAVARRDSLAEAARLDSIAKIQAAAPITEDLGQLRELGPTYIPYDRGPRLVWDTEAQALLATTLLPVIREEELEARTTTYFWLLVRADGTVDQAVLQTSSGHAAFDAAAQRAARAFIFAPAIRGERAVPTWIVRDVSLLMQ